MLLRRTVESLSLSVGPSLNCPQYKYETLQFPSAHIPLCLHVLRLEAALLPRQMPFSLKTGLFVSAAISWQIERQAGRYLRLLCTPACFWHSQISPLPLSPPLSLCKTSTARCRAYTLVMRPAQKTLNLTVFV